MEVRWVSLDGEEKKASTWSDLVELAMRNVSSHIQQAHPHLDGNRRDWVESSMVVTLGKLASAWRSGGRQVHFWNCPMPGCQYRIDFHVITD
jgi:hypothetical protein